MSKEVPAIGPMKFGWPTDVFWLRYEKYHQTLSFLIGPPTLMFVSRYFYVSLLCGRMLPPGFVTGSYRNLAGTVLMMFSPIIPLVS